MLRCSRFGPTWRRREQAARLSSVAFKNGRHRRQALLEIRDCGFAEYPIPLPDRWDLGICIERTKGNSMSWNSSGKPGKSGKSTDSANQIAATAARRLKSRDLRLKISANQGAASAARYPFSSTLPLLLYIRGRGGVYAHAHVEYTETVLSTPLPLLFYL